jgi:hypothetical protein
VKYSQLTKGAYIVKGAITQNPAIEERGKKINE